MDLRVDNKIISLNTIKLKIIDIIVWNFVHKLKTKRFPRIFNLQLIIYFTLLFILRIRLLYCYLVCYFSPD